MRTILFVPLLICFVSPGCTKQEVGPDEAIAANKALDMRFSEALKAKNPDLMMDCWWKDPQTRYYPSDNIDGREGWDAIKASVKLMIDGTERIVSVKALEPNYRVLGGAVVSTGRRVLQLVPKGSPKHTDLVVRYTDIRELKNGRWVYVYVHESMNPMLGSGM